MSRIEIVLIGWLIYRWWSSGEMSKVKD